VEIWSLGATYLTGSRDFYTTQTVRLASSTTPTMSRQNQVPEVHGFILAKSGRSKAAFKKAQFSRFPPAPPAEPIDRPIVGETRDEFQPPLVFDWTREQDQMLDAVRTAIEDFNTFNLAAFMRPLVVSMVRQAIHPLPPGIQALRLFAIGTLGNEEVPGVIAKVPIYFRISQSGRRDLMVMNGESNPMLLKDWLKIAMLPRIPQMPIGAQGYELQLKWWEALGGAPFRFTDLPSDLQRLVLLHMVGEVRHLDFEYDEVSSDYRPTLCKRAKVRSDSDGSLPPPIDALDHGHFCLSRAVYHKLKKDILPFMTIKHMTPSEYRGFQSVHSVETYNHLNRIQLDFDDLSYLTFFGGRLPGTWKSSRDDYGDPGPDATMLQMLPNLRYLELWFHSTVNAEDSNPWPPPTNWGGGETKVYVKEDYPCRRGMVDRILTFGYRHLKDIACQNPPSILSLNMCSHLVRVSVLTLPIKLTVGIFLRYSYAEVRIQSIMPSRQIGGPGRRPRTLAPASMVESNQSSMYRRWCMFRRHVAGAGPGLGSGQYVLVGSHTRKNRQ
jgi:hypothetical protein